jgi:hypothetical protein
MNNPNLVETRVLITVMTYPHPSPKYKELICTAGVAESGDWVRLYPIDYRYRPTDQRFHKYQWVDVELGPVGHGNDRRKESRKPNLESLAPHDRLDTKHGWRERRRFIDPMPHHTLKQLEQLYEADRTSLGIVRPTRVLDVEIEAADQDWKPEWQAALAQFDLFAGKPKELVKLPHKWSYVFECEDSEKPHKRMIEDWELGVLYLKEREKKGDAAAAESVRYKYLTQLCDSKLDTRFFMGTRFPYNTWLVLGVFYPPKILQGELAF